MSVKNKEDEEIVDSSIPSIKQMHTNVVNRMSDGGMTVFYRCGIRQGFIIRDTEDLVTLSRILRDELKAGVRVRDAAIKKLRSELKESKQATETVKADLSDVIQRCKNLLAERDSNKYEGRLYDEFTNIIEQIVNTPHPIRLDIRIEGGDGRRPEIVFCRPTKKSEYFWKDYGKDNWDYM